MPRKSEKGGTLVVVTLIFAVILILGTVTLATVSYSQKYALHQVDRQQGYYVAKSGVDIAANYILDASNKNGQVLKINELLGAPSSFEMTDNKGYIWDCDIRVTSASPKVEIVSKATNRTTNTQRTLTGFITDDGDGASSQIRSFDNIKIDTISDISFVDTVTQGGGVDIKSEGKIDIENIYSYSSINIESSGVNKDVILGNVKTQAGATNITIKATGNVKVSNIDGSICTIEAGGDVTISGIVKAEKFEIKMPSTATLSVANNNVYTNQSYPEYVDEVWVTRYKYTVNGADVRVMNGRDSAPTVPGNVPDPIDEAGIMFTPINSFTNTGTIYFEKPPKCSQPDKCSHPQCCTHPECLVMRQVDRWNNERPERIHILPVDPTGVRAIEYYRLNVGGPDVKVVFQNFDGKRGDGTKEKYNIFMSGTDILSPFIPVGVYFENCKSTAFYGNIKTQTDGFNINDDATGLQFGTPPYTFVGYKE